MMVVVHPIRQSFCHQSMQMAHTVKVMQCSFLYKELANSGVKSATSEDVCLIGQSMQQCAAMKCCDDMWWLLVMTEKGIIDIWHRDLFIGVWTYFGVMGSPMMVTEKNAESYKFMSK